MKSEITTGHEIHDEEEIFPVLKSIEHIYQKTIKLNSAKAGAEGFIYGCFSSLSKCRSFMTELTLLFAMTLGYNLKSISKFIFYFDLDISFMAKSCRVFFDSTLHT